MEFIRTADRFACRTRQRPQVSVMSDHTEKSTHTPPNSVEAVEGQSNYLRGAIAAELAGESDHFTAETAQLLKHHGIYQQDDRERHVQLGEKRARQHKTYQFMVRTSVPGGALTSQQLLAHIELAEKHGNGTLRITSRQDLQLHGLAKADLRTVLRRIHEVGLTTMAACGDVNRNVACCPAPYRSDPVHAQMQWMARQIAAALAPRTSAYRETWLDAPSEDRSNWPHAQRSRANGTAPVTTAEDEIEPLYGASCLPRTLKVGIGLPGDNCVDVYCQDIGLLAVCRNYDVIGYNLLVGGGMGMTPATATIVPALAQRMAYVRADRMLDVVRAIVGVFRELGERNERKRPRLKRPVADWRLEQFKKLLEQRLGFELPPLESDDVWDVDDHLGWHEQGDGRWFYGLHVPGGRIHDAGETRLRTALSEICEGHSPAVYLTPGQNLLLGDIYWEDRLHIEEHLRHCGLPPLGELSNVRRWANACVSLPSCPQALTETDRALPEVLRQLEGEVARLGLQHELFALRMTGCASGCSRPYNGDIGIVGREAGRYGIYLGGRRIGDRLGFLYRDAVPLEQLVATLVPVLAYFKQHRQEGERLGDFCYRLGPQGLGAIGSP
jgi:sulfite reductase (ferredoxin)